MACTVAILVSFCRRDSVFAARHCWPRCGPHRLPIKHHEHSYHACSRANAACHGLRSACGT